LFATASRQGAETQKSASAGTGSEETTAEVGAGAAIGAGTAVAAVAERPADKDPKMSATDADLSVGKTPDSAVQNTSRAGTYTVPYRDDENEVHSPPIDSRQGTSSTRFEQQSGTHADGVLADGTPVVREDGQGTSHTVMEPRTVGQAPKDTPLYRDDDGKPTVIEQAQHLAEQAYEQAAHLPSTVMSAVGLGGKKDDSEGPTKAEDPRVDAMESHKVEEFMRDSTKSQPAAQSGA